MYTVYIRLLTSHFSFKIFAWWHILHWFVSTIWEKIQNILDELFSDRGVAAAATGAAAALFVALVTVTPAARSTHFHSATHFLCD